ncbi:MULTISPECIES: hypothetical protein [unclassified Streptomyces]|uniref:hypothetical protein n=1 Tax=unclassified Streptomyces TaxID=2593676 RepID=UPI00070B1719|nr:hypothetical protein [Streptomyces sp. Root1310]KQX77058.1 hypothetical protein ASD48_38395 [Streptomyces sp. Root1310]
MGAGPQAVGEEAACFVTVDRPVPFARHMTVTGVDLDRRASGADAEFDRPVRRLGTAAPAALDFRLPLLHGGDLRVDAGQPQRVPHPQGLQTRQVLGQIIEHIFDSRCTGLPVRLRVRVTSCSED